MTPGFGDGVPSGKPEMMTVRLTPTGQSAGEIGQAVLVALAKKTALTVQLSGVPDYVSRPVHLYTYIYEGVCGKLSAKPAYSLNVQATLKNQWKAEIRHYRIHHGNPREYVSQIYQEVEDYLKRNNYI